jgi:catechol 2,3-dioxygenase-like lactoylglutathione lyase family enzyme
MIASAKFAHVNIIAQDWKRLAQFYEQVLGCRPVPPERSLSGQWLEDGTGVPDAEIRGIHLRLPGYGGDGPTLEVFEYNSQEDRVETAVNRPGFAHIAFAVEDVGRAREAVLAAGGEEIGQVVSLDIPNAGRVTFVYLTDPEGNIIELQHWSQD